VRTPNQSKAQPGSALDIRGRALDWLMQYLFGALRAPGPLRGPTTGTDLSFAAA